MELVAATKDAYGTEVAERYLSDSPRFLLRQRARGTRALVSEHVGSVTCDCTKCKEASSARVQKEGLRPWVPAAGFTGDAAVLDDMVGSAAFGARGSTLGREETRRTLQRSPTGVTSFGGTVGGNSMISSPTSKKPNDRDFAWLLRVLFDFAEEDAREIAGRPSFLEDLVRGGGRPASSNKNAAHLGPFGVGVKIPETVILEKGKPKRRYSVDPRGTPEVTKMKTSAELLRVLREFVRKAAHHMGRKAQQQIAGFADRGGGGGGSRGGSSAGGSGQPGRWRPSPNSTQLNASASEPSLPSKPAATPPTTHLRRASTTGGRVPPLPMATQGSTSALIEAAVLYYVDGAVRNMTSIEAATQMAGVSKLPREFWQHIGMLQVPVQSGIAGKQTRYITYRFNVRGSMLQPQAPTPLALLHRRSPTAALTARGPIATAAVSRLDSNANKGADTTHDSNSTEASRVAAVPQRINAKLAQRKRGQVGAGIEIVSGQLEFVLDEEDDSLWLVNATNLRCQRRKEEKNNDEADVPEGEEIRYFKEEEFDNLMKTQAARFEAMKKRFNMSGPPGGMVASPSMSAADRLAGVTVPDELNKYVEAEEEMLRHYDEEVKPEVFQRLPQFTLVDGTAVQGQRSVGLSIWFKRWVVAVKGRKWRQVRAVEAMMAESNLPHWRRPDDD